MLSNNLVCSVLAIGVLVLMYRVLGPKKHLPVPRRRRRQRTVRVDPLVAKERKLASELRLVRAQLKQRDNVVRHL